MTLTIGIDIGGTKIAGGVVDESGTIVDRTKVPTPAKDGDELFEAIATMSQDLAGKHDVAGVGVGVAGFVDLDGTVQFAPHLAWRKEPVRSRLADRLDMHVVVENDANVGGWAEAQFGAAREVDEALFVAVGTGIGGALISKGGLLRGGHGMAGEIGHICVVTDGRSCPCGLDGCWEEYASGRSLLRLASEAGFDEKDGAAVTHAAVDGDERARQVIAEIGRWLGVGMASVSTVLDPAAIVVGGGVSTAGDLLLDPARAALRDALPGKGERPVPDVVPAELGPDAALIGAANLARP